MLVLIQAAVPRKVAEWICQRIPLFEWTPVEATYDDRGRGTRLRLLSPAAAAERDGRDYHANRQTVIEELTSPEMPTPNGVVFGLRTGGKAGTSECLEPGKEYEFQWRYPFPGPGRWGFYLRLQSGDRATGRRVSFLREVTNSDDARGVLIEMVRQARSRNPES